MKTWNVVTLAAILGTGPLGPWGCYAGAPGETEDEDIEDAEEALARHDGQGEPRGGTEPREPDQDCMGACRGQAESCRAACRSEQMGCFEKCGEIHKDCARSCGWGSSGGCNSLNSADCGPWWNGWAHP